MKILISSHAYAPSLGGIETVSRLLAHEFRHLGHEVQIVTQTPNDGIEPETNLRVHRRPNPGQLLALLRWADVFWHNNLSLRTFWPVALRRSAVVITHQGSYCQRPHGLDTSLRLKHFVANHTTSVAPSRYVAQCFRGESNVIPNPYDARVFNRQSGNGLRAGIAFVGRVVSEKGIDVLLEAVAHLGRAGIRPSVTIVGDGPELFNMRQLAQKLGLTGQVIFAGAKSPDEIAAILNRHLILAVPSRYDEPFGVVALEGIACGCAVVGSAGGGLPEAIGPCGVTFPNGQDEVLAAALQVLLAQPNEIDRLLGPAREHLAALHPRTVAESYLEIFSSVAS